jgi:hypothetical protein
MFGKYLLFLFLISHAEAVKYTTACLRPKAKRRRVSSPVGGQIAPVVHDLRPVLADVYLTNKLSAYDTFRLARGAASSGSRDVGDIASSGSYGKHVKKFGQRHFT